MTIPEDQTGKRHKQRWNSHIIECKSSHFRILEFWIPISVLWMGWYWAKNTWNCSLLWGFCHFGHFPTRPSLHSRSSICGNFILKIWIWFQLKIECKMQNSNSILNFNNHGKRNRIHQWCFVYFNRFWNQSIELNSIC